MCLELHEGQLLVSSLDGRWMVMPDLTVVDKPGYSVSVVIELLLLADFLLSVAHVFVVHIVIVDPRLSLGYVCPVNVLNRHRIPWLWLLSLWRLRFHCLYWRIDSSIDVELVSEIDWRHKFILIGNNPL